MIATSIDLIFQDVAGYGQIVYKHFMLFWLLSDVLFFSFRAFSDIETLYFRESGKTYKKFNDYLELTGYIYDVTATFFWVLFVWAGYSYYHIRLVYCTNSHEKEMRFFKK